MVYCVYQDDVWFIMCIIAMMLYGLLRVLGCCIWFITCIRMMCGLLRVLGCCVVYYVYQDAVYGLLRVLG